MVSGGEQEQASIKPLGYKMVLTNTFRQFDPYTVAVGKIIT
jgi:hypothetical protein